MNKSLFQRNPYLKKLGKSYGIISVASSTAVETGKPVAEYIKRSLAKSNQRHRSLHDLIPTDDK
ncbi:hypothetical protein AB835_13810 [Candidatus Endobugula sertula]|uniref:Uncharacterized protein n=1 Tax=Candidatus Endobugula sertula TaxID=62101 RepID=A0A1D2QLR8_9GAMM|nr:hypothetical protein AB835_13810 [Candidatus Endobugula sertula]